MVHVLTPVVVDYINVPATKNEIEQPSVEKMRRDIAATIRDFLINPVQCTEGKWAEDRFWENANDEYIHAMARGFQDWFHDMFSYRAIYNIVEVNGGLEKIVYNIYIDALKNAIDIFGAYALEQQAVYVAGALFTVIEPIHMFM